ncbi:MAG: dienelactone hydrolase family protein [Alphaproteobacteria bacterium]|nr:dienelactone hydrolase family protein [Alphaproteobacteria bacterium]
MTRSLAAAFAILAFLAVLPAARAADAVVLEETSFEGFPVLGAYPKDPVGLVFLFHGSGGSADFARRDETQAVLSTLVGAGYAVVSTSSTQRSNPKRWRLDTLDPGANEDLGRIGRLYASLLSEGRAGAATPVFAMGMSNGGGFTVLFGRAAQEMGLPIRAIADYEGPIVRPVVEAIEAGKAMVPIFLVLAENDPLVNPKTQLAIAQALVERGLTLEIHIARERPVAVADFAAIPEVSEAQAREIFDTLVKRGVIDKDGKRRMELAAGREGLAAVDAATKGLPKDTDVRDALLLAFASHKMRPDYAEAQLAFFERYRGN